jgi:hypothetical protein
MERQMNIELTWASIAVIISILTHGGFSVWWASKITSQIDTLVSSLTRMDKELEKRDTQISAVWKRVDIIGNRLSAVESRFNIEHKDY